MTKEDKEVVKKEKVAKVRKGPKVVKDKGPKKQSKVNDTEQVETKPERKLPDPPVLTKGKDMYRVVDSYNSYSVVSDGSGFATRQLAKVLRDYLNLVHDTKSRFVVSRSVEHPQGLRVAPPTKHFFNA